MNEKIKRVVLRPGKEESLLRWHPWVFSGAVASLPENIEEGDMVTVYTSDGRLMGVGHYQIGSIAVRMIQFGVERPDDDIYYSRLVNAYRLRETLGLIRPDNNCY